MDAGVPRCLLLKPAGSGPHICLSRRFARAQAISHRQDAVINIVPLALAQSEPTTSVQTIAGLVSPIPAATPPVTEISPSIPTPQPGVWDQPLWTTTLTSYAVGPGLATAPPSSERATLPTIVTSTVSSALSTSMSVVSSASSTITWSTTDLSSTASSAVSSPSSVSLTLTSTSITSSTTTPTMAQTNSSPGSSISSSTLFHTSSLAVMGGSFPDTDSIISATSTTDPTLATATVPPVPAKASSLSAHDPTFYAGIALGTLAVIACILALVAWWIRLRNHARRRRAARTRVPWARSNTGLEAGDVDYDTRAAAVGAMNLGSREDLGHVQAWSPRGDRDVGEPRRAPGIMGGSTYSLHNHPIPGHDLFSDDSMRALAAAERYSTSPLRPPYTLRQLPSHLINHELANSPSGGYGSRYAGHPASLISGVPQNPGYNGILRGHAYGGHHWSQQPEASPRSMAERLRNLGKPTAEAPWEPLASVPNLPPSQDAAGTEAWSTSIRSSLVSAFNAVAANLAGAPIMEPEEEDHLTPAPPKRSERHPTQVADLSRDSSFSTVASKPWTLEETREGAGVVHLNVPELNKNQPPSFSSSNLSFGDGNSITTGNDHYASEFYGTRCQESQIPLIASSRPDAAFVRPDGHLTRGRSGETVNQSLSRSGTAHSTSTVSPRGRSQAQAQGDVPQLLPFQLDDDNQRVEAVNVPGDDSIVIQPDSISRLTSTSSSLMSSTLHTKLRELGRGSSVVSEGLKERLRKSSMSSSDQDK